MEHLAVGQAAGSVLPSEVPWGCCPWPWFPYYALTGSAGTVQPSDATGGQWYDINSKQQREQCNLSSKRKALLLQRKVEHWKGKESNNISGQIQKPEHYIRFLLTFKHHSIIASYIHLASQLSHWLIYSTRNNLVQTKKTQSNEHRVVSFSLRKKQHSFRHEFKKVL